MSPNISFFVLTLFFKYIKNENFLNSLTLVLFSKKIHFKLIEQCQNPPKNLSNYETDWNNAIKPQKFKFRDYVMLNYTENFAKALLFDINSPFSDINSLIKKLENKYKGLNGGLNINSPDVYKSILEELYHIFSNREMEAMHIYHSQISKATGIQTGLSYKDDHLCFMNLMHKTLILMKQGYTMETDEKKFIANELRTKILFNYLKSVSVEGEHGIEYLRHNSPYFESEHVCIEVKEVSHNEIQVQVIRTVYPLYKVKYKLPQGLYIYKS